jgi:eukaryotic-like serine/threonine-protein kinase
LHESGYIDEMPTLVADRYRLGAPVGRGGMGRVWRAHDQILDREVAVKEILPPHQLADPEAVHRRTLREARAAARLSHPGVVRVFDVCEVDGGTWIVMEYVPSRSLQEVLAAEGPLPPRRVAKIGLDLLDALVAAARAGVEHRDVKPANVLLTDDGRVLLTDFGIASIADDPSNTTSDLLIGSPEYMSPERVRNDHVGLASDLWSLAATLYAAVEGHSPFHRPTVAATLTALAVSPPDPPTKAGPLTPLLLALLQKDPADRPSAGDAAKMLRAAASGAYGQAVVPQEEVRDDDQPAEIDAVAKSGGRRWPWLALAAFLVVVVAGAAVWFSTRPSGPPSPSAKATTSPSVSAATSPSVSASTSASPSRPSSAPPSSPTATSPAATGSGSSLPALPPGWRSYHDKTGFSVYVPAGWSQSQKGTIVYFRGDGRVLGIDQSSHPKSDPLTDWRTQSSYRVARGDFPGYHQIRLEYVDYFEKSADWEYTFDGSGGRQHVDNRNVLVSSQQAYGIYWQTSDATWTAHKNDLALIYASFRPRS